MPNHTIFLFHVLELIVKKSDRCGAAASVQGNARGRAFSTANNALVRWSESLINSTHYNFYNNPVLYGYESFLQFVKMQEGKN